MKKILLFTLIICFSFTLSACFNKNKQIINQSNPEAAEKKTVKESLFAWINQSQGVECVISDPMGTMNVQAKADKVKISRIPSMGGMNEGGDKEGYMLTVGKMMYMWSGDKGNKIDIEKMEKIAEEMGEEKSDYQTWNEMVNEWDKSGVNYDCEEKALPDSVFTPPADVEFTDLSQFMEDMADMSKQMQQNMESGNMVNLEELEAQAKKMQEQFAQ